jgi:hypothetical protein
MSLHGIRLQNKILQPYLASIPILVRSLAHTYNTLTVLLLGTNKHVNTYILIFTLHLKELPDSTRHS